MLLLPLGGVSEAMGGGRYGSIGKDRLLDDGDCWPDWVQGKQVRIHRRSKYLRTDALSSRSCTTETIDKTAPAKLKRVVRVSVHRRRLTHTLVHSCRARHAI